MFGTVPDRCVTFISELRGAVPTIVTVVPDTVKSSVGSCTTPSIVTNKAVSPRGALVNVNVWLATPVPVNLSIVKPAKTSDGSPCPM